MGYRAGAVDPPFKGGLAHSDGLQRMTSQKQALDSVDTEPPKVPRCDTQVPSPSASVGYGEFGSDTGLRNGPNM